MTEEIIIDGIDVANCGYLCETDKECSICGTGTSGEDTFCRDCKDNSNCYYKQLKRLEQENKELKELKCKFKEYCTCDTERYRSALEEIREILNKNCGIVSNAECVGIINEVLK